MSDDGGIRPTRTATEEPFLAALLDGRPWLHVWLHQDDDGTPWACVSHDFVIAGCIRDTLRLDFDGEQVLGGWSPANLNWDDGVRALEADMDVDGPDGLRMTGPVDALAAAAGEWFDRHDEQWHKRAQQRLPPTPRQPLQHRSQGYGRQHDR